MSVQVRFRRSLHFNIQKSHIFEEDDGLSSALFVLEKNGNTVMFEHTLGHHTHKFLQRV